eukprot:789823-Pleurochrysis_carterae.AAC.2
MQRLPSRRCLLLRSGLRRAQLAIMTRAFVAIGADIRERVGASGRVEGNAVAAAFGRDGRERRRDSCPASTLGAENAASKIMSCRKKSASRAMRAHWSEEADVRRSA